MTPPGPASPVPVPKEHQRPPGGQTRLVVRLALEDLTHRALGAVRVGGWEMGQHSGPIDSFPIERRVGELINQIPREFLGEEVRDAEAPADLGKLGRVSEGIGQPEHSGASGTAVAGAAAGAVAGVGRAGASALAVAVAVGGGGGLAGVDGGTILGVATAAGAAATTIIPHTALALIIPTPVMIEELSPVQELPNH